MKPDEACELFDRLCAYYDKNPRDATRDAWLNELRLIDLNIGSTAVRSLVVTCKFWPSVAELYEQVANAREQAGRERRDQDRRENEAAYDALREKRPPLRDVPSLLDAQGKHEDARRVRHWLAETIAGLDEEGRGPCDDCGAEAPNTWRYGTARLCEAHAKQRLRAGLRLNDDAAMSGRKGNR
jgi:hypothetical protein